MTSTHFNWEPSKLKREDSTPINDKAYRSAAEDGCHRLLLGYARYYERHVREGRG